MVGNTCQVDILSWLRECPDCTRLKQWSQYSTNSINLCYFTVLSITLNLYYTTQNVILKLCPNYSLVMQVTKKREAVPTKRRQLHLASENEYSYNRMLWQKAQDV